MAHELNRKSDATIETLIPNNLGKTLESKIYSRLGYNCVIDYTNISKQIGELEKMTDDIEEAKTVYAWIRIIEETYGVLSKFPCKIKIILIQLLNYDTKKSNEDMELNKIITVVKNPYESDNDEAIKENLDSFKNLNIGDNNIKERISSSNILENNTMNIIYIFKASLYEKKTPHTVKMLIFTVWILYLLLGITCGIEWGISYLKGNDIRILFDYITAVADRMNSLSATSVDSRTLDLLIQDKEKNSFYGDSFYEETRAHVFYLYIVAEELCQQFMERTELS